MGYVKIDFKEKIISDVHDNTIFPGYFLLSFTLKNKKAPLILPTKDTTYIVKRP